jgi:hypothetical protein
MLWDVTALIKKKKKVTDFLKAIILYWCFIVDDALTSFMTECGEE